MFVNRFQLCLMFDTKTYLFISCLLAQNNVDLISSEHGLRSFACIWDFLYLANLYSILYEISNVFVKKKLSNSAELPYSCPTNVKALCRDFNYKIMQQKIHRFFCKPSLPLGQVRKVHSYYVFIYLKNKRKNGIVRDARSTH